MCAVYVLLGLCWLVACSMHWREILRLQFWTYHYPVDAPTNTRIGLGPLVNLRLAGNEEDGKSPFDPGLMLSFELGDRCSAVGSRRASPRRPHRFRTVKTPTGAARSCARMRHDGAPPPGPHDHQRHAPP